MGRQGQAHLQAGKLSQTREGIEPLAGLSPAEVESLDLKSCCFSSRSLQLCLDSPNCSVLLYLMVLRDSFCCVTLAPNFSFSLRRLDDRSAEQQFGLVTMAAALIGLLATWESAGRVSDLNTASSTSMPSWGFWEPLLSSTP